MDWETFKPVFEELRENIAFAINETVRNSCSSQKFSTVTLDQVADIIEKEIQYLALQEDVPLNTFKNQLITFLNSHYKLYPWI